MGTIASTTALGGTFASSFVLKVSMNFVVRSGPSASLMMERTRVSKYAETLPPNLEVSVMSIKWRIAASFAGSILSAGAVGGVAAAGDCVGAGVGAGFVGAEVAVGAGAFDFFVLGAICART